VHLSIFDLDRTLIKTNLSFKFYLYLYKKKVFDKKSIFEQFYFFIKFKYFNISLKDFHELIFNKILKNKSYDDLVKHGDIFLDKYLEKLFYLPVIKKLHEAILNNHYIALFSCSPIFLVKPIADILEIKEYKATLYELNEENKFEKIKLVIDGKQKTKYAQNLMEKLKITKDCLHVYSDSIDDLELFELAGKKFVVKPCKKLYKLAMRYNWEIL